MKTFDGKTARNDITGESLRSRKPTDEYRTGWDLIFGKKNETPEPPKETKEPNEQL